MFLTLVVLISSSTLSLLGRWLAVIPSSFWFSWSFYPWLFLTSPLYFESSSRSFLIWIIPCTIDFFPASYTHLPPRPPLSFWTFVTLFPDSGFPGGSDGKASTWNAGDLGSIPGSGRSPWRRKWQPTPVLLPGICHGRRNLVGYSPWGRKESETTERLLFLSFPQSEPTFFPFSPFNPSILLPLKTSDSLWSYFCRGQWIIY